ncbi:MAG: hypothetical protein PHO86_00050 [Bacilli bacterium]|nr:hypothetical protein [Bacilli bacterium]
MDKYDKFIEELKDEANSQEISDYSKIIKARYLEKHPQRSFKHHFSFKWALSIVTMIVIAVTIYFVWPSDTITPITELPELETVDETYAFEIAAAANMVYTMQATGTTLSVSNSPDLLLKYGIPTNNTAIKDVATELNKYIFTIRQLLNDNTIKTTETVLEDNDYQYQMFLSSPLSDSKSLEYTMYYNKTNITDESYSITGVIDIEGTTYQILGAQETEDSSQVLVIRIFFGDGNFISIHQIVEENMLKFVYREFENKKRTSEMKIGIGEVKGYRVISIVANEGKIKGRFTAFYKDSELIINSRYEHYRGNIKVEIIDNGQVKYYFIDEDEEIIVGNSEVTGTLALASVC